MRALSDEEIAQFQTTVQDAIDGRKTPSLQIHLGDDDLKPDIERADRIAARVKSAREAMTRVTAGLKTSAASMAELIDMLER